MKKINQMRLKTRWQDVKDQGYPPKDNDPFYGDRYSIPVLAMNEKTGQVATVAYVWDYECGGWMPVTMEDGPDACDYEVQHVTHWALWPECRLVDLEG